MTADDNSQLPLDKAELLRRLRSEFAALELAYSSASLAQMITPEPGGHWSIKDNLAHLAGWLRFMRLCFLHGLPEHEAFGMEQAAFAQLDETGWNAVLFERNKDRPVAEVIAELQREHALALAELQNMPFADLQRPLPGDEQGTPLLQWIVNNSSDHYREHRLTIARCQAL